MRSKRFSVVLIFSLLSGVGLVQYFSYKDSHPSTEDAYVQAHIVNIASRVSGPVVKLHVSENDYVNTGDILFEIDPSVFHAVLQGASANYELAKQAAGASDAKVGMAKSTLDKVYELEKAGKINLFTKYQLKTVKGDGNLKSIDTVSYTHLTLPTKA